MAEEADALRRECAAASLRADAAQVDADGAWAEIAERNAAARQLSVQLAASRESAKAAADDAVSLQASPRVSIVLCIAHFPPSLPSSSDCAFVTQVAARSLCAATIVRLEAAQAGLAAAESTLESLRDDAESSRLAIAAAQQAGACAESRASAAEAEAAAAVEAAAAAAALVAQKSRDAASARHAAERAGAERDAALQEAHDASAARSTAEASLADAVTAVRQLRGEPDALASLSLAHLLALLATVEAGTATLRRAVLAGEVEARSAEAAAAAECAVCLSAGRDTALNCGHVVCAACAARLTSCPLCRQKVRTRTRVFI